MSETTFKRLAHCSTVEDLLEDPARWNANARVYEDTRWCLLWAIDKIYGTGTLASNGAYKSLIDTLRESFGLDDMHNVSWWESRPERTHAEVLEAVRRAGI